jgi:hypothetical protein
MTNYGTADRTRPLSAPNSIITRKFPDSQKNTPDQPETLQHASQETGKISL